MPFQFSFSLPHLSLPLPSLKVWSKPPSPPRPPPPPSAAATSLSPEALGPYPSLAGQPRGRSGWLPSASTSHLPSTQLSEVGVMGLVQSTSGGWSIAQTRAREDEDLDLPPAKRRRTMASSVIDLLSYTLHRSDSHSAGGGVPFASPPSSVSTSPSQPPASLPQAEVQPELLMGGGEPPPYSHAPPSAFNPGGKRRPASLNSDHRRRRHPHQPAHPNHPNNPYGYAPPLSARARKVGGKHRGLTPSTSTHSLGSQVGGFNPFRSGAAGSPRGLDFPHHSRHGSWREDVNDEGEGEGEGEAGGAVVGSVPSVIDLQISRMDHTLHNLLAEGARALGHEVVLPDDENSPVREEDMSDSGDEWQDE